MLRSSRLPNSKTAPKKASRPFEKSVDVVVTLTAEDYKKAIVAAKLSRETVAEWISSLVNIALQP
jgi:hypothetical protein